MNPKAEIKEFLTTRRARITPEDVGLRTFGDKRRVPGLRREEVALLAGVSVEYYARLERGNMTGVSESVLNALAGALQLDDAERAHLFDLARAAQAAGPARRKPPTPRVRPSVQRVLGAIAAPAYLRNGRGDVLGANQLGRALYAPMFESVVQPPNTARFVFLDPRAPDFFVDWDQIARDVVAALRTEAGRDPYDKAMADLVGELSMQSDTFRSLWAQHDVRFHDKGSKRLHHPVVGELTLSFESLQLSADPGLTIAVHTAEPGSKSEEALNLLASWAAPEAAQAAAQAQQS